MLPNCADGPAATRNGSNGTSAPALYSTKEITAACTGLPPRSCGLMPSTSRAKVSRAARGLRMISSAARSASAGSTPLPTITVTSRCRARAASCASSCARSRRRLLFISRLLVTDSHSPSAIEQAPAVRPASPARMTASREAAAPSRPITRQKLDTSPSLTPSTAARKALPLGRWIRRRTREPMPVGVGALVRGMVFFAVERGQLKRGPRSSRIHSIKARVRAGNSRAWG